MWERVEEKGEALGGISLALSFRVYRAEGKEWPKLSMGIYKLKEGLKISIQGRQEKTHWYNTYIPKSLISELQEMLEEVRNIN